MSQHQGLTNCERMKILSAYDETQAVLEKRQRCLEVINRVARMEELFSTLSFDVETTALELSKKSQATLISSNPGAADSYTSLILSENCIRSVQESWNYLHSLAHCNHVHLQDAASYHQFWHEVEESNEWLQQQLNRVPELFSLKRPVSGSTHQLRQTMRDMMELLKDYLQWQTRLDLLYDRAKHIVPLRARTDRLTSPRQAQVLVDFKAGECDLREGDTVTVVDNSNVKTWRIRVHAADSLEGDNSQLEHSVPAIIIQIPPTDPSAQDAALRLRLQLLSLWTASTKVLSRQVTRVLLEVFRDWNKNGKASQFERMSEEQRVSLVNTVAFMERTLGFTAKGFTDKGLPGYDELTKSTGDIIDYIQSKDYTLDGDNHKVTIIIQVNYLRKFLQRYWDFWTYCDTYRVVLEQLRQPKNIFICTKPSDIKYITTAHFVKYWDCDLEDRDQCETQVEEEVIAADQTDSLYSANRRDSSNSEEEFFDSGMTERQTETEEVIESEMEVETTFVITGIVSNPGEESEVIISLQDAIDCRIIDPEQGLYVNRETLTSMPIPQAMNEGLIKMGPKKEKVTEEKVKSSGIITLRATRETRPYTVQQVLDTRTGEMIPARLAHVRGILDSDHGTYKDLEKGTVMLIGDAVEHRLVDIEYEANNYSTVLEEVTKTYSVHEVVCQKTNQRLSFHQAVAAGILDKESGDYLNNMTGEKVFVVDAISRGYVIGEENTCATT